MKIADTSYHRSSQTQAEAIERVQRGKMRRWLRSSGVQRNDHADAGGQTKEEGDYAISRRSLTIPAKMILMAPLALGYFLSAGFRVLR